MLKLTDSQKKLIMAFVGAFLLAVIDMILQSAGHDLVIQFSSFLYLGMVIAWGFLMGKRMVNTYVRRERSQRICVKYWTSLKIGECRREYRKVAYWNL